jgi:hypothetical protein
MQKNVLTHEQFHLAVLALQKHKQAFLDARLKQKEAAAMLSGYVGFKVSENSMLSLCNVSGVLWEVKRKSPDQSKRGHMANIVRSLVRAHRQLCLDLGRPVPVALAVAYEYFERHRKGDEGGQASLPPSLEAGTKTVDSGDDGRLPGL